MVSISCSTNKKYTNEWWDLTFPDWDQSERRWSEMLLETSAECDSELEWNRTHLPWWQSQSDPLVRTEYLMWEQPGPRSVQDCWWWSWWQSPSIGPPVTHTVCYGCPRHPSLSIVMWEIKLTTNTTTTSLSPAMVGSNMLMVTLSLNPPQCIVVMTTHFYQEYKYINKYVFCNWENVAGSWYLVLWCTELYWDSEDNVTSLSNCFKSQWFNAAFLTYKLVH